ncbi:MAG: HlyD family efflux transporter periplasmic adaptor subunit [Planctomycetes bacterium]|nr:HlyD family efflux transporter periplasmic adaptor subunit [Planctomycetota bacterium]
MTNPGGYLIGQIALREGLIAQAQLDECLREQAATDPPRPLGQLLVEKGRLTAEQLRRVIEIRSKQLEEIDAATRMSRQDSIFGSVAVSLGFVSPQRLNECLREQELLARKGVNKRLGRIMHERGYLTSEKIRQVLEMQRKRVLFCPICERLFNVTGGTERPETCVGCGGPLIEGHSYVALEPEEVVSPDAAPERPPVKREAEVVQERVGEASLPVTREASEVFGRVPPVIARSLVYIVLGTFAVGLVWAWLGKVDVVVEADAILVPRGYVQKVTAPLAGEVAEEPVIADGARVAKGDRLLVLKSRDALVEEAERRRLEEELRESEGALERFRQKKESVDQKRKLLEVRVAGLETLNATTREYLTGRLAEEAKLAVERARNEVERATGALASAREDLSFKERAAERAEREHEANRKLLEQNLISEQAFRESEGRLEAAGAAAASARGEVAKLEREAQGLQTEVRQKELEFERRKADQEKEILENEASIGSLRAEKLQAEIELRAEEEGLEAKRRDAQARLARARLIAESRFVSHENLGDGRIAILAPADGVLTSAAVRRRGEIVAAGQMLATIAPLEAPVIAELRVQNRDIGFVRVAQEVKLLYEAFPYQEYGVQRGRVRAVAPDAVMDAQLGPVYTVEVDLVDRSIRLGGEERVLGYGLKARAQIVTERKSLLSYLLKPFADLADQATAR